jgi:hypothetical protein
MLVTLWWKVSVHTAAASGTVAILVVTFGPPLLLALPAIALVAWSRIRLGDHTPAQTLVGAALGGLVATTVFYPAALIGSGGKVRHPKRHQEEVAGMTAEVLLLGGEKSPRFLREVLDALHGTLPRSQRIELARMGHGGPSSEGQPERVAEALRIFFAGA